MRLVLSIAALVLLASPRGAEAQAHGSLLVAAAEQLCARNHAVAARVLAKADAAGWTPLSGGRLADMFNMTPNPSVRLKTEGADHLMLRLEDTDFEQSSGVLTTHKCTVFDEVVDGGAALADLVGELSRALKSDPAASQPEVAMWFYVDDPRGRRFLSASKVEQTRALEGGATMISIGVTQQSQRSLIEYAETTFARK